MGFIGSNLSQKGSNSTHTLYCTAALVLSSACLIALSYIYIWKCIGSVWKCTILYTYLSSVGKDASKAIAEKDECFAYVQGAQLLDSVCTSIINEEVNVECIETITRHRKNFDELVKCCYGQQDAVNCDYILQRTRFLALDIAKFQEMRRSLLFLSTECLTVLSANREARG